MELENGMDIDLSLNPPHFETFDQEEDEENENENSSKQIRYIAAKIFKISTNGFFSHQEKYETWAT